MVVWLWSISKYLSCGDIYRSIFQSTKMDGISYAADCPYNTIHKYKYVFHSVNAIIPLFTVWHCTISSSRPVNVYLHIYRYLIYTCRLHPVVAHFPPLTLSSCSISLHSQVPQPSNPQSWVPQPVNPQSQVLQPIKPQSRVPPTSNLHSWVSPPINLSGLIHGWPLLP